MTNQRYSKTAYLVLCGLFAALTAICSIITIPLGFTPIPLNLGTLAVFLAGGILGRKYGTISIAVYVLLGAAGIPVFSGFRGGIAVLAGPTGGYIAGYIAAAFVIGWMADAGFGAKRTAPVRACGAAKCGGSAAPCSGALRGTARSTALCICALILGTAVCYTLGTLWFMFSTGSGLPAALTACVFPFLPGDALKILAAAMLIGKLRRLLP